MPLAGCRLLINSGGSYLTHNIGPSLNIKQSGNCNYNNIAINCGMGYEIPDYPHLLLTALLAAPQTPKSFLSFLASASTNNCDALLAPVFADQYLESLQGTPELDHCFVLSDQHLKRDEARLLQPVLNDVIWQMQPERRAQVISTVLGYSGYLNLRGVAARLTEDNRQSILEAFEHPEVKSELGKSACSLAVIVQTGGAPDDHAQIDDQIWLNYVQFRQALDKTDFPLSVELVLVIKANAPANRIVNRWKAERIAYAVFQAECFVQNNKGYAILPAKHERLLHELVSLRSSFGLRYGQSLPDEQENSRKTVEEYLKFALYSFKKFAQNKTRSQKEAISLIDCLQNPLQPYADNLESATYQVFENDQPKYKQYQDALESAFQTFPKNKRIVVYYIGAGRGGLLFNTFAAAKKSQRRVFVYAIQKNLYPIQTIKKRVKQNKWQDSVQIVYTDIRDYEMPEKPDVFLSELLGGFGDNELSPQCLYWAEKNIAPETICIPTSYTAYIRPVCYSGVHRRISPGKLREIYYTVYYGSYYTSFASQEVWKFEHPLRDPQRDPEQTFSRHSKNTFTAKEDLVISGFAGYFSSHLYSYSELSILPERPTLGMFSWFPLFFSFQGPEFVAQGQQLTIEIWRKGGHKRVWYEWRYQVGDKISDMHNAGGRSVAIQL